MERDFLPISKEDMTKRGWDEVDFAYVIGDAYVDHPSFGPAIISRVLESQGYRVGIISQPDWKRDDSIALFGKPRLGFLVCGGNMDTMVNHYTAAKKHRKQDAYTPGGLMGRRPDRAVIVYGNLIRRTYKDSPIILGGIEASLRRLGHYDYWSDKVRRSVLLDSGADLLSYGMGERSIVEIADALASGLAISDITFISGTAYKAKSLADVYDYQLLPEFDQITTDKRAFAESFYIQYCNTDPYSGQRLVEKYKDTEYVVQNPPPKPLSQEEMDAVYRLPYQRTYHPSYEKEGGVPAMDELAFSLTSSRGCFGGCSFCALTFHQGRIVQARSHASILEEAKLLTEEKGFKGYIHDVGGPTANFRHAACEKQKTKGACPTKQCLFPAPCKNLNISHQDYCELLKKLRSIPKVKKVFIRSGIRFDYLMYDKDGRFMRELCKHHVSGQLKVAPEHVSDKVLSLMGKPKHEVYQQFLQKYQRANQQLGKKQYVVPYLMSSHPGSDMREAVKLAEYIRDLGYMPEQVQDFYPTPATISTCMYYTGLDPRTMQPVYVPRSMKEKQMQRALIQYRKPENYELVAEALRLAGRTDLIGFGENCLISPRNFRKKKEQQRKQQKEQQKEQQKREKQKKEKHKKEKHNNKGQRQHARN